MGIIVQKYGGTSVGSIDRIRNVARRVIKAKKEGHDVVVILSAMAGETDRLINLAKSAVEDPDPRELDVLMSTGEQTSVALFSMVVQGMGYEARSLLGYQAKIITDRAYGRARIHEIDSSRIKEELARNRIVAVAGFQGLDERNNITTLGRGGSDTTAVALAAALQADVCEIYTDVDGVYTTDPNICPDARKISRISYKEMLEMASLGAKVLEIRSVELAAKYGVVIHVRSSFNENPGTLVLEEDEQMEDILVTSVTYSKKDARVTLTRVPDKPGVASKIFTSIAAAGIVVDAIIQNQSADGFTDLSFTVPKTDYKQTINMLKPIAVELGAKEILGDEDIGKVSVVGVGMRNHAGVAAKMFKTLSDENINIMMITTSEIKISCVIEGKYTELAVRVLHDAFGLAEGNY
ncbi:MAG: aspartate kinase [Deltaproteobacteria bacterium]|nr:aspartate kinase [Deltaproteobacteria bacterium]